MRDTTVRPAKMKALHSSAALAVNVFDYWSERDTAPLLQCMGLRPAPACIEFEAQFSTGLAGTPPNLDVAIRFASGMTVGVESKFTEWLVPKPPNKELFKPKYFPESEELWSKRGLSACQALAASLRAGTSKFRHLDVGQLLKHALGLATQCPGEFSLYYLSFQHPGSQSLLHDAEVEEFERLVGAEIHFRWSSYQQLYKLLSQAAGEQGASYIAYLGRRYFPGVV